MFVYKVTPDLAYSYEAIPLLVNWELGRLESGGAGIMLKLSCNLSQEVAVSVYNLANLFAFARGQRIILWFNIKQCFL